MTISARDAGSWKTATPYAKDAGTWKAVTVGYVKDAGTWKPFMTASSDTVNISATSVSGSKFSPTDCTVTYSLDRAGTITRVINGVLSTIGTWITPGSSSGNYEVRATLSSGTSPGGDALNTWLAFSADRTWFLTNTNNFDSIMTCTLAVQIRRAADAVVVATANVTIEADVAT